MWLLNISLDKVRRITTNSDLEHPMFRTRDDGILQKEWIPGFYGYNNTTSKNWFSLGDKNGTRILAQKDQ
jgi:hypothetical protein